MYAGKVSQISKLNFMVENIQGLCDFKLHTFEFVFVVPLDPFVSGILRVTTEDFIITDSCMARSCEVKTFGIFATN